LFFFFNPNLQFLFTYTFLRCLKLCSKQIIYTQHVLRVHNLKNTLSVFPTSINNYIKINEIILYKFLRIHKKSICYTAITLQIVLFCILLSVLPSFGNFCRYFQWFMGGFEMFLMILKAWFFLKKYIISVTI